MKTADSIEQQEERKAARDVGNDADSSPANTPPVREKFKQRDASRIAAWRWQPGQSGNPTGRPRHDLASEIAKAVFENNSEMIYKAYAKAVARGNAYAFKELADRAYGRLKERHELEISPYHAMSDEDLLKRIRELEDQLGVSSSSSKLLPPESESKPN